MLKLGKYKVRTPAICGSILGPDTETMLACEARALEQGAELIELRIDGLIDPTGWEKLLGVKKIPTILTNRPRREGGKFKGRGEERIGFLREGISRGVACIDLEYSTPKPLRRKIVSKAKEANVSLLMSYHDFSSTPPLEALIERTKRLVGTGCDLAKIVTFAKTTGDALRVLDFLAQVQGEIGVPVIAFAMGGAGRITRITAPLLNSPIVYASVGEATAPGQLDVRTTKRLLRELIPRRKNCEIKEN